MYWDAPVLSCEHHSCNNVFNVWSQGGLSGGERVSEWPTGFRPQSTQSAHPGHQEENPGRLRGGERQGKRQNNCSRISRSTLSEAAQLYLILHQSCFSLKSDHQMIFRGAFVPQWRNDLHLSIIICVDHSHLILLRRVIGDIETDNYIILCQYLLHCYKDLIDLQASESHHRDISICIKLHVFTQFGSLNKIELLSFIFSIYQNIWAVKAWWTKYDKKKKKNTCKLFFFFFFFCLKDPKNFHKKKNNKKKKYIYIYFFFWLLFHMSGFTEVK